VQSGQQLRQLRQETAPPLNPKVEGKCADGTARSAGNALDAQPRSANTTGKSQAKHLGDWMRIAFLGVRVAGHLNPMTALARKLKARRHDVVFISILDTEHYVRAAQLPFIPYCEKEFPLGSVRQMTDQLSKLQGQAALEFTLRSVASALESSFKNLPQTLLEARVGALVLDQVYRGLGLVPMHLGIPYVHVSNALHLDYSGNTPLCAFDWPHETTPEALARNQAGVRKFMQAFRSSINADEQS
jgi:zeaxanthin glucosyltransferase